MVKQMKNISLKKAQGLTLVEILMTVFILSIAILSSLLFFTTAITSTEFAKDVTLATSHGEYFLEEMTTRPSLANITGTNWVAWGQSEGLTVLPSETFTITYVNAVSNPLDIQVTVRWTKKNRTNTVVLNTKVTK